MSTRHMPQQETRPLPQCRNFVTKISIIFIKQNIILEKSPLRTANFFNIYLQKA